MFLDIISIFYIWCRHLVTNYIHKILSHKSQNIVVKGPKFCIFYPKDDDLFESLKNVAVFYLGHEVRILLSYAP